MDFLFSRLNFIKSLHKDLVSHKERIKKIILFSLIEFVFEEYENLELDIKKSNVFSEVFYCLSCLLLLKIQNFSLKAFNQSSCKNQYDKQKIGKKNHLLSQKSSKYISDTITNIKFR